MSEPPLSLLSLASSYEATYARLSREPASFAYDTDRDEFGKPFLRFHDDGSVSIIILERREVVSERRTQSEDELLYWVFKDELIAEGLQKVRAGQVPEGMLPRTFAYNHAIDRMASLRGDWERRLRDELDV